MTTRPGAYLADSFPWLKYLPWYGRELRQGFIEDYTLFHRQLGAVKRQMVRSPHPGLVDGDASKRCSQNDPDSGQSFAKFLLSGESDFGLNETEMAFLSGASFSAGVDTVCDLILSWQWTSWRSLDSTRVLHYHDGRCSPPRCTSGSAC